MSRCIHSTVFCLIKNADGTSCNRVGLYGRCPIHSSATKYPFTNDMIEELMKPDELARVWFMGNGHFHNSRVERCLYVETDASPCFEEKEIGSNYCKHHTKVLTVPNYIQNVHLYE